MMMLGLSQRIEFVAKLANYLNKKKNWKENIKYKL